jgi:hypothetical protein
LPRRGTCAPSSRRNVLNRVVVMHIREHDRRAHVRTGWGETLRTNDSLSAKALQRGQMSRCGTSVVDALAAPSLEQSRAIR